MPDNHTLEPVSLTGAQEALRVAGLDLRRLFDRFPFAVQVFAPDGRPLYYNPAHRALWGYDAPARRPNDDAVAERRGLAAMGLMPLIRRAFQGESVALPPTRYTDAQIPSLPEGCARWVRTYLYPVPDERDTLRAVVVMHVDVTEREAAQQLLEERVAERTRELSAMLEVSRSAASTLDLRELVGLILDELKSVADYSGATVVMADETHFEVIEDRGGVAPERSNPEMIGLRWPLGERTLIWETLLRREPVLIADAHDDSEIARAFRSATRRAGASPAVTHVRSWLAVPLVTRDRVVGFVGISKDEPGFYTEQHARLAGAIATHVAAAIENARLFARERQTSRELAALLEISRTVTSTLDLEPLLALILDQVKLVIDYVSATIVTLEEGYMVPREYRGPLPRESVLFLRPPVPLDEEMRVLLGSGEAYIIPDIWAETPQARAFREQRGEEFLRTSASYLRCMLVAPIVAKGSVQGALFLTHSEPGFYAAHHAALATAVAGQAGIAIENARLYTEQRRTAAELASLLEVASNLSSTLELEPLLDVILDQMKAVADYSGASIAIQEGDSIRELCRRLPEGAEQMLDVERALTRGWAALAVRRRPLIVGDIQGDEPAARAFRERIGAPLEQTWLHWMHSWMAVPMQLRDRAVGTIILAHQEPNVYTRRQADLAMALAAQAAAAIDNAQLFGQAQRLAALEERQRLARELHDSVSQVLFSIGLGARTAKTLLERGSLERVAPAVEYIANLAEMGTAEMRALLFELRPESLQQEGLVAALTKQAAALRARHSIEVATDFAEEPETGLDVKEALYRIAQEAMHNTVKHAGATSVTLRLRADVARVSLEVRDDGRGFDPSGDFPGHLGLRSMRERVERLGGEIAIESAPQRGTAIRVTIPT